MTITRGRPALQPAGVFILYSTTLPADESVDQQVRFRWTDGPISHTYSLSRFRFGLSCTSVRPGFATWHIWNWETLGTGARVDRRAPPGHHARGRIRVGLCRIHSLADPLALRITLTLAAVLGR